MNLKETLEKFLKKPIEFEIKKRKSCFLSFSRCNKITLHPLFLKAPKYIVEAISRYLLKKDRKALFMIRSYAEEHAETALDTSKLKAEGNFYNLKQIFNKINDQYFNNSLNLHITWFKKPTYRKNRHITFGSYDRRFKLIKINKLLDSDTVPTFFIEFIVYHEMLHHICPVTFKGQRRRVHEKNFKEKEKLFAYYESAKKFKRQFHGRS